MKYLQSNSAFTLAEVLITLGIIGIVASMTIPTLIANYQKTQYVAGLKKAYAESTEALNLMANDHDCPGDLKCSGVFGKSVYNYDTFGDEFTKYFKLAKNCKSEYNADDESTICMSKSYSRYYDGKPHNGDNVRHDFNQDYPNSYSFITADGFSIFVDAQMTNCEKNTYNLGHDAHMSQICGTIAVDVNGLKGPNNLGRDIFSFFITNGKGLALYPRGGSELKSVFGSWVNTSGKPIQCIETDPNGGTCAGRIMEEGWQMNY